MKIITTGQTRSDAKRKYEVMVSDEDFDFLSQFNWQADPTFMIKAHGVGLMTRLIMQAPPDREVDHIDGNRLNNQRNNLRLATSAENKCNRGPRKDCKSGFKGVSWHGQRKKWTARIKANGSYHHLGLFQDIKEAVLAYNDAARKYHGEFAFINRL